jgi:hypothetical protein
MTLISALKIFSSLLLILLAGCLTFSDPAETKNVWIIPVKPKTKPVEIIPVSEAKVENSGYYMSKDSAKNLADNIDELKAYIQKMDVLVEAVTKYHGDSVREYKHE